MQSFNHALEHSMSWRGLKWRMEAWRTGRSFAEVVLCHTLVFRVEQVFLIHQPTGLLIQHIVALDMLEARGTPGVAFSHDSARIGEARDAWNHGVISHCNPRAVALGFHAGGHLRAAIERVFGAR